MLDPAKPAAVDLKDFPSYISSCLSMAEERLAGLTSIEQVAAQEDELNRYPRLDALEEPRDIRVLDDAALSAADRKQAVEALLEGSVLLEHACAGEATRLGLGTKYLINPRLDLNGQVLAQLLGEDFQVEVDTSGMRSISLGRRHMLQLAWDLWHLAEEHGRDPEKVLAHQRLLVIVNEATSNLILQDFLEAGFYGFDPYNVYFMVQVSFHGITRRKNAWAYDTQSPRRLHNHGQMLMQTTMDNQIFRSDSAGRTTVLTWREWRQVLQMCADKVSFNIEDLDYLERALDLQGLAMALKLGDEGFNMVMEVVANNPDSPQKGGLCAYDPELERNVMIESFQLAGMPNGDITFLNKNINHYPQPARSVTAVRERGLSMPVAVKEGHLYFQPVQGDVNFLVPTAFVRRAELKAISAWKGAANTPDALLAMKRQEDRSGFLKWAQDLTGLPL